MVGVVSSPLFMLQPFVVCFEAHRPDGKVWAVKWPKGNVDDDKDWTLCDRVQIVGHYVTTAYRGPNAEQPKAYLEGCAARLEFTDDSLGRRFATIA